MLRELYFDIVLLYVAGKKVKLQIELILINMLYYYSLNKLWEKYDDIFHIIFLIKPYLNLSLFPSSYIQWIF